MVLSVYFLVAVVLDNPTIRTWTTWDGFQAFLRFPRRRSGPSSLHVRERQLRKRGMTLLRCQNWLSCDLRPVYRKKTQQGFLCGVLSDVIMSGGLFPLSAQASGWRLLDSFRSHERKSKVFLLSPSPPVRRWWFSLPWHVVGWNIVRHWRQAALNLAQGSDIWSVSVSYDINLLYLRDCAHAPKFHFILLAI